LFFWEGLRWIPFGLLLIVVGVQLLWPDSWLGSSGSWAVAVVVVGAFWAEGRIGRYYAATVGTVRDLPGAHRRRTVAKWMLIYPAMLASLLIDSLLDPPILISGMVWAAAILLYLRSTGGGRRHYLLAAALLAATTILPLTGMDAVDAVSVLIVLTGAVFVVGGVLDHLELNRVLHPTDRSGG
jgi:hypothetical protein